MPATLSYNYATYYERLEAPMPFYLDSISEEADGIAMNWEDAVDLQNDVLSYEVYIFTNPDDPAATSLWSAVWLMALIIGKRLLGITMETGNVPLIAARWSQATGNRCGSG